MDEQLKYPRQQTILDAFLSPPEETIAKINIAERAIRSRLKDLRKMDGFERTAVQDAQRMLRVLTFEVESKAAEANAQEESPRKKAPSKTGSPDRTNPKEDAVA